MSVAGNARCSGTKASWMTMSLLPVPRRPDANHVSWIAKSARGTKNQSTPAGPATITSPREAVAAWDGGHARRTGGIQTVRTEGVDTVGPVLLLGLRLVHPHRPVAGCPYAITPGRGPTAPSQLGGHAGEEVEVEAAPAEALRH